MRVKYLCSNAADLVVHIMAVVMAVCALDVLTIFKFTFAAMSRVLVKALLVVPEFVDNGVVRAGLVVWFIFILAARYDNSYSGPNSCGQNCSSVRY
jgi:hypothetical protein